MPSVLLESQAASSHHWNVLLLLGIAVFGGTVGTRTFRRLRIPQIISFLIGGELNLEMIKKYGKRFAAILPAEDVAAFILVAGEIGLNVREEDLIETCRVADVADRKVPIIPAGTPLKEVIRDTFATQELNDWLIALDIMEPVVNAEGQNAMVGVLNCPATRRSLSTEVLSRQEKADNMHGTQCA